MPPLADIQRAFAGAMLAGPERLPRGLFARGPVPAAAALAVHRSTVLSGLCRALALSFPTVKAVAGERYFGQAAMAYAAVRPPRTARLDVFGADFPAFLDGYVLGAAPHWLGELARLDLLIARAAASPRLAAMHPIDAGVAVSLPVSLRAVELGCGVDLIRDAVEASDPDALALIEPEPSPRWLAIWRLDEGAAARPLSPPAGVFLQALTAGVGAEAAIAAASAAAPLEAALLAVQAEVFSAPFAEIIQTPVETDPS